MPNHSSHAYRRQREAAKVAIVREQCPDAVNYTDRQITLIVINCTTDRNTVITFNKEHKDYNFTKTPVNTERGAT